MLIFKPFFVHKCRNRRRDDSRRLRHAPRGFTVYVTPSKKERCVDIQVALCHYNDEFSKKSGRAASEVASAVAINARDLPRELEKLNARLWDRGAEGWRGCYDYVLRYVV